ncbi:YdcF family protein [Candidatus Peregrinibacteria bacterium]|nr:YdcF family protein [Candidatus Peregrinibacteria bacterium]
MTLCKKGFIGAVTVIAIVLAMPFMASLYVNLRASSQIYTSVADAPAKDAALVLGAAVYGSRLSDILRDRVDTAIEIYKADKVKKLVMSGAPHEAKAMANYAEKNGVPTDKIAEDPKGLDTASSVKNLTAKSVVIVTQRYHLPRALFLAGRSGIDAVGIVADKHEYIKIYDFKKRELFATSKAIMDMLLFR